MTTANSTMNAETIAEAMRRWPTCRGDLLAVLPWSRRSAFKFIAANQDEVEACLGRKLRVAKSEYIPSGRGAFGRSKGGSRAHVVSAAVHYA